ncbi:transposon protein, CACTA, En/Spm sub-class [Tanacetum coccineum]
MSIIMMMIAVVVITISTDNALVAEPNAELDMENYNNCLSNQKNHCPKQPGNDIDVYLEPLIDDMTDLWDKGIEVYDAYKKERFKLFAMIFCTISDFPEYGNLSGYGTKGEKACPVCEKDTHSRWLTKLVRKPGIWNIENRSLPESHSYRKKKKQFDGRVEHRKMARLMNGHDTLSRVKDIKNVFGKKDKALKNNKNIWKKKSIFWKLPYWEHLQVRHSLDVMHIEKNVSESLIGLLLNIKGKTKDGINARKDMVEMRIKDELAPQEVGNKRTYLRAACYSLSKAEKNKICQCLHYIKVPSGYFANIKKLVSMKDLKLIGMKSHDCRVLIMQMIPIAIRGILPPQVHHKITKLCLFFNMIHSKVIDPEKLDEWQRDIILTLCQLEMYNGFLERYQGTDLARRIIVEGYPNVEAEVTQLAYRPRRVFHYQGYDINGYTFYTKEQDEKSTVQNSGVTLVATTTDNSRLSVAKESYYNVIEEIWELDYNTFFVPLFKCKWVDNIRGVKVDKDGFTCVNLSTYSYSSNPFILAKQATKIFYVEDPSDTRWNIVIENVVDEDE